METARIARPVPIRGRARAGGRMTLDPLESEWTAGLSTALVDSKLADAMRDLLGA